MKEVKVGDIIKLKEDHAEFVTGMFSKCDALHSEVIDLSKTKNDLRKTIWDFVYSMYPELENLGMSYNREKGELLITSTMESEKK